MSHQGRFSPEEKYKIVMEASQLGVSTAELCRRHGIACSVFYRWEAQMRNGAKEALADKKGSKRKAADHGLDRLRSELAKKNNVIAKLTEALIQEKKGLSNYLRPSGSPRK
jgi:transposase